MKRLFVSLPMRGKTGDEIIAEHNRIVLKAQEALGEALVPVRHIFGYCEDEDNMAARRLGNAISCMAEADVVAFGKGWEKARGCRIEHQVCLDYDIDIVEIYSD